MWMVDPGLLCRQHLLGEHRELHTLVGTIRHSSNPKRTLRGFFENKLIELHNLRNRHEQLVFEMEKRKYNHQSPLPEDLDKLIWSEGVVDKEYNLKDLRERCIECRKLQEKK